MIRLPPRTAAATFPASTVRVSRRSTIGVRRERVLADSISGTRFPSPNIGWKDFSSSLPNIALAPLLRSHRSWTRTARKKTPPCRGLLDRATIAGPRCPTWARDHYIILVRANNPAYRNLCFLLFSQGTKGVMTKPRRRLGNSRKACKLGITELPPEKVQ